MLHLDYRAASGEVDHIMIRATADGVNLFPDAAFPAPGATLPPQQGTVTMALDPALGGAAVAIAARAVGDGKTVATAEASQLVLAGRMLGVKLILEPGSESCVGSNEDSDRDGICDAMDRCMGFSDEFDSDEDTVPDGCDACPGFDDRFDPDGDGLPSACDACPGVPGELKEWYPDCDGDGVFANAGAMACDIGSVDAQLACAGQNGSTGGWSAFPGDDCNDGDAAAAALSAWYPDCDGDGVFADGSITACGAAGANAALDCIDGADPDGGWSTTSGGDCDDEDSTEGRLAPWYPDCDGDQLFGTLPVIACSMAGADAVSGCSDGAPPDGRWSASEGTDCNDEQRDVGGAIDWYPDCDGDGVFGSVPTRACSPVAADFELSCRGNTPPQGGWSAEVGGDCDDDDAAVPAPAFWYPDCDGDGVAGGGGVLACTPAEAGQQMACPHGGQPRGGWKGQPGADCNDQDDTGSALLPWYPDCDGDRAFATAPVIACGLMGANAAPPCADQQLPDGGWSDAGGTDCNDEEPEHQAALSWYSDCDGDGIFGDRSAQSCGPPPSNELGSCADHAPPDGGWSLAAGSDCNDDDPAYVSHAPWYPDCDGDAAFAIVATRSCGPPDPADGSACSDDRQPDGGWSESRGNDCDDDNPLHKRILGWYPDCDGDGFFGLASTPSCGPPEPGAGSLCGVGGSALGGWSTAEGDDCDDEDAAVFEVAPWYPDCDGDGVFAAHPVEACSMRDASDGFRCSDSQPPAGGWSGIPGADCDDDDSFESPCWFSDTRAYRRKLTVHSERVVSGVDSFPVLVASTLSDWRGVAHGGHVSAAGPLDFVFTGSDASSKLNYEIEKYDPALGALVAWVQVPRLAPARDTVLYVYYGGRAGAGDLSNPRGVWNGGGNRFKGVWHLAESGTSTREDSTQFLNHCATVDYDGTESRAGIAGDGDAHDGSADHLDCGNGQSLNITGAVTLSLWVHPTEPQVEKDGWMYGLIKFPAYGLYLYGRGRARATLGALLTVDGELSDIAKRGSIEVSTNTWSHIAVTHDGSTLKSYVNGVLDMNIPLAGNIDADPDAALMVGMPEDGDGLMRGIIDEVRISDIARSAGWIGTSYSNQARPDLFYSLGNETTQ